MIGRTAKRALVGLAFAVLAVVAWLLTRDGGPFAEVFETKVMLAWLGTLGGWGPAAVVALMTTAILVSPIPSAPVALAAGAAYGHGWGTLYVLLGAEAGALIAFLVARYVGYEFVHRHLGARLSTGLSGSQNALMTAVFVSRLMPFVSFDMISYAAGLTVLSFPRFAIATLAGILPASFLLAHFGSELSSGDPGATIAVVALLGVLGIAPLLAHAFTKRGAG